MAIRAAGDAGGDPPPSANAKGDSDSSGDPIANANRRAQANLNAGSGYSARRNARCDSGRQPCNGRGGESGCVVPRFNARGSDADGAGANTDTPASEPVRNHVTRPLSGLAPRRRSARATLRAS